MAYPKIAEKDALLLIRALGLLISQASVYGPTHKVTQNAARSVFAELEDTVKQYGAVEIALHERQLYVNGAPDGISEMVGKNLTDRMALHKIGGLIFQAPALLEEFLTCITLLGTAPVTLERDGGFDAVLKRAGLKSIHATSVAFQRIAGETREAASQPEPQTSEPAAADTTRRSRAAAGGIGVLDLSDALASEEHTEPQPGAQSETENRRREQSASLAEMLRETAAMLEQDQDALATDRHQAVVEALERIRHLLTMMTTDSEQHITALADQVDNDRQTIASIESAARRRGIGLKLTRGELVQRYAELNQEIVQPLTVSTGVIGLLKSEHAGALTPSQRDLLKMAEESVERVNQLVSYMNRISGLPDSYTPDAAIIRDTYR